MTFTVNNSRKSLPEKYWHKVLTINVSIHVMYPI